MGYRFLEHATDAVVELEAPTLEGAFRMAGDAAVYTTLDPGSVEAAETRELRAEGKDLEYLLFSWLEEVIHLLITEGFAVRDLDPRISGGPGGYRISCVASGEPMDLSRHGFKVEIKAPTFHDMVIREGGGGTYMRFLLDL